MDGFGGDDLLRAAQLFSDFEFFVVFDGGEGNDTLWLENLSRDGRSGRGLGRFWGGNGDGTLVGGPLTAANFQF